MSSPRRNPDIVLFTVTCLLLVIGVVMVASASFVLGQELGDPFFYVKRQILWVLIGVCTMIVMMKIDYHTHFRWAFAGLLVSYVLLALVIIIGPEIGGSQRWLPLGEFRIQPSEFAKLAIINFLAVYLSVIGERSSKFVPGILIPLFIVGIAFVLIFKEPDMGTSVLLLATAMVMLFVSGARMLHLGLVVSAGIPAGIVLIKLEDYRMRRIFSFLDPWEDRLGSGWNIIQSLLAIGSGGLFGLGLGQGREKFGYLPAAHTDFIFAVIGEELGFMGTFGVIFLFFLFAWRGLRIAINAPDHYGSCLAAGITGMTILQAVLNIGVVTGMLPVTGITLPLISAGGSSLVITLAGIGVLLNISLQQTKV